MPKAPTAIDQLVRSKTQCKRNSAVPNIKRTSITGDDRRPAYTTATAMGASTPPTSRATPALPTGRGARTHERPTPDGPAATGTPQGR